MRRYFCLTILMHTLMITTPARADAPATAPTTTPTDDRTALTEQIKTDEEAIKSINAEIAGFDKDATDAEAAAKNPPANLSEADKATYIDEKKNDEQAAQDSAAQARERLGEAQKDLNDAKARLKALGDKKTP